MCDAEVSTPDICLHTLALVSKICEVTWEAVSHKRNTVDMNEVEHPTSSFPSHITLHQQQRPMGLQRWL